jgi:hypothetical protein
MSDSFERAAVPLEELWTAEEQIDRGEGVDHEEARARLPSRLVR